MEAVSARLHVLDKEVADLAADIKELYAEKRKAPIDEKSEIQEQIKQQEEKQKHLLKQRHDLQLQLTAGGMQQPTLPIE